MSGAERPIGSETSAAANNGPALWLRLRTTLVRPAVAVRSSGSTMAIV
jgi:hypothetical protein